MIYESILLFACIVNICNSLPNSVDACTVNAFKAGLDKFWQHQTVGWSKKRRDDGTDDGTPGGRYATGHCPVVVYV